MPVTTRFVRNGGSRIPVSGYTAGLEFDMSDMIRGLDRLDRASEKGTNAGLTAAGEALALDILNEDPPAPELTSALRSGMAVFVNGVRKWTSLAWRKLELAPVNYLPVTDDEPRAADTDEAKVVVNAPYATFQHETYHRGYVLTKLWRFGRRYGEIIAAELRRSLR